MSLVRAPGPAQSRTRAPRRGALSPWLIAVAAALIALAAGARAGRASPRAGASADSDAAAGHRAGSDHGRTHQPAEAGGAGDAAAQPAAGKAGIAAARMHFYRGKKLHHAGHYEQAAAEYLAAYRAYPQPAFLYNAAQVYRLAGNNRLAVKYYQKYLHLAPHGLGAANARSFLVSLKAELAEARAKHKAEKRAKRHHRSGHHRSRRAAAARHHPAALPGRDDARSAPIEPEDAALGIAKKRAPRHTLVAPPQAAGRGDKIAGAVVAGAGVLALAAGVKFGLDAASVSDQISGVTIWNDASQASYASGHADQRNMYIACGVGAAAVVTGAVLYYFGVRAAEGAENREVTLAPAGGGGRLGIALSGRF